ncbi:MAG: DUF4446 family protein [Candidatus Sungbacteria bacterium]|nr:DUF4446 family protein [Candidatus Sungbacteria bacterium]
MNWILAHQFYILLAIYILGSTILVRSLYRLNKKVTMLLGGAKENEAYQIIHRVIEIEEKLRHIEPQLKEAEKTAKTSIQKIGFLRFNPFEGTGGDNSFVMALLDKKNDGVLVSSLYLRDGMRIYGKKVDQGKTRYPLLDEEKKVLEETIRNEK